MELAAAAGQVDPLARARAAYAEHDYPRMVAHIVGAESWASKALEAPSGPAWLVTIGGSMGVVELNLAEGRAHVEAPALRLPRARGAEMLREALERQDERRWSRISLRGDVLVVVFVGWLDATEPEALRDVIVEVTQVSRSLSEAMAARYGGAPVQLDAFESVLGFLAQRREVRPLKVDLAARRAATRATRQASHDDMPPILAPANAAAPARVASAPRITPQATSAPEPRSRRVTLYELDVAAIAYDSADAPTSAAGRTAADRMCEKLRQARTLAESCPPALAALLLRGAVFQVVHAHQAELPDAVAYLYRATAAATRDAWRTSETRRPTPLTEKQPAIAVFDRVIAQRGEVPPEPPLTIDPFQNVAEARTHLGRYLAVIEKVTSEHGMRFALAIGALTELLVRAKLPEPTVRRLEEIVAHAYRDPTRPAALQILMTTLKKIVRP